MLSRPSNRHRRAWAPAATTAIVLAIVLGLAACSSSSPSPAASGSARQTIVFAESGLVTEVQQTERAVSYFERANPRIHVKIDVLSPDSTTYLSQLEKSFTAGSATRAPDIAARLRSVIGQISWTFPCFPACRSASSRRWSAKMDERFTAAD